MHKTRPGWSRLPATTASSLSSVSAAFSPPSVLLVKHDLEPIESSGRIMSEYTDVINTPSQAYDPSYVQQIYMGLSRAIFRCCSQASGRLPPRPPRLPHSPIQRLLRASDNSRRTKSSSHRRIIPTTESRATTVRPRLHTARRFAAPSDRNNNYTDIVNSAPDDSANRRNRVESDLYSTRRSISSSVETADYQLQWQGALAENEPLYIQGLMLAHIARPRVSLQLNSIGL